MRVTPLRFPAAVAAVLLIGCLPSHRGSILRYDQPVQLSGRVVLQEQYGPPNYGENPDSDSKVRILVLQLRRSISVKPDTGNTASLDSMENIREVQLLPATASVVLEVSLADRWVTAHGSLAQAITGGHYTRVVMFVRSITTH